MEQQFVFRIKGQLGRGLHYNGVGNADSSDCFRRRCFLVAAGVRVISIENPATKITNCAGTARVIRPRLA
jgi:hypothetical protein